MAKKDATTIQAGMRRCIGSATFGIEAHEAPVDDFPVQPSQRDGLGRMCKPHWRQYTNALRKAAVSRKAAETATDAATEPEPVPEPVAEAEAPTPRKGRRLKAGAEAAEVPAA